MYHSKFNIRFILLVSIFFYATGVSANNGSNYSFIRVDAADGLVNNQITCIFKDSRGFIWIGTSAGLSRYDGIHFVNYKHNDKDSSSIIDNFIESIQEDRDGNIWVKTRWEYTLFEFDKEIFNNNIASILKKIGIQGVVSQIFIDKKKNNWFLSQVDGRPYIMDSLTNQLTDPFSSSKNGKKRVRRIYHFGKSYYCLYEDAVIERFSDSNFRHESVDDYLNQLFGNEGFPGSIFVDKEGDIWAYGNIQGLYHYQSSGKTWKHYTTDSPTLRLSSNIIQKIAQDDKGLIWVGTDHGGVDIVNKFSNQVQTIYHQKQNDKSIPQNSITDVFIDNNNIVWIGTYKQGICYYHESIHKFLHYHSINNDKSSLPYNDVNCFVEDKKGNLWIGTNGGGLIYFDRTNRQYKVYKQQAENLNGLSSDVIVSLFLDKDGLLWIGTYAGGLSTYNGKIFVNYRASKQSGLTSDNIWTITQDSKNRIWVGTLGGGIVLFDKQEGKFQPVPTKSEITLPEPFVSQIFRMRNGNMFIGTSDGIIFYDINESRYRYHPRKASSRQIEISNNNVNAVFEDSRGLLWIATREGLTMIDPNSDYKKIFRTEDGLPRDIINCILEDEYQSIWISKSSGLSQIVVAPLKPGGEYEFSVFHYTEADGLQGQEFNVNACCKTKNGELIFGGPNGFNLFQTQNIKYNKYLPKVVFTDFQIFNKSVKAGKPFENRTVLTKSIVSTNKIVLNHSMNVFSIEFAALNFFVPEKVKYKYMLQGFDKDWVNSNGGEPKAVYTNLNPGTYVFKVKACNNDGVWDDAYSQLRITILPPFYASPVAYLIYLVIIVGLVIYFRYAMLKKTRLKFEIEQERILAKRNHELDEMKLKFLTNVSHEFRTPLTLILTPIEKLRKKETESTKMKLLETVERNANNLLELVNQLLDFRKLDLHGLKYNPAYGDIVSFLKDVCENFKESFEKKSVELIFKSKLDEFYFMFDRNKLQKVMMNLVSNALKFTNQGGKVRVLVKSEIFGDAENIIIKVKDTGIGISDEEKDKIFERFYQSKNNISLGVSGSGIGLNLAKEMVILHGGAIHVESELGKGAEFIVTLPTKFKEKLENVEEEDQKLTNEDAQKLILVEPKNEEKPVILLIEDNFDFRNFMKESLDENYIVHEAKDGIEGFDMVHKIIPDLIISDVMMPRMDGLELCRKLKGDIRSSHIPLILLTARTADEDKIKGLEIGADDYITKPFNMDLLLLRIQNAMDRRKKIQQQFQKNVSIETSEVEVPSMEEKLIKKAVAFVEKNIDEPKFSVEDLSAELGMSRVYLYKKLLAITGKTPVEFIRIIRLKRGAQLLEKSKMNVAEVAYAVGFNSPRYFSKYFKDEYGVLPKAYMKMYGRQTDDRIDIT